MVVSDCICADDVSGDTYTAAVRRWGQHVMGRDLQHQYLEVVCEFSKFGYKIPIRIAEIWYFVHRTEMSIDNEESECCLASA